MTGPAWLVVRVIVGGGACLHWCEAAGQGEHGLQLAASTGPIPAWAQPARACWWSLPLGRCAWRPSRWRWTMPRASALGGSPSAPPPGVAAAKTPGEAGGAAPAAATSTSAERAPLCCPCTPTQLYSLFVFVLQQAAGKQSPTMPPRQLGCRCNRELRHAGPCNHRAAVPGLLAYSQRRLFEAGVNVEELCRWGAQGDEDTAHCATPAHRAACLLRACPRNSAQQRRTYKCTPTPAVLQGARAGDVQRQQGAER